MVYRAIGLMSGSSLDGLDITCAEFTENAGKWSYVISHAACLPYEEAWKSRLKHATSLSAKDYLLLHTDYGHYLGSEVKKFIESNKLDYQVALIASHGHTTFHIPEKKMTGQLGDGAAIAAETGLPVVTDLRALDVALGGQGAPIVPIGEKLLLGDYDFFLNLGGIANISRAAEPYLAFDICAANRVLNMLASDEGNEFDQDGEMAASGSVDNNLLEKLNSLEYYKKPFPKSLANDFGTDIVYPIVKGAGISTKDGLRTYVEHIAIQVKNAISSTTDSRLPTPNSRLPTPDSKLSTPDSRLLATGGGALNSFLVSRLKEHLSELQIKMVVPEERLVNFKEALIMAFIGVLRWRQEYNVMSSVTGSLRDSIGGALWTGQDA